MPRSPICIATCSQRRGPTWRRSCRAGLATCRRGICPSLPRACRTWARRARRTAGENIAEYLQEEGRDLVTKTEMEEFLRGVDEVREAVDRIEARLIERLERPLERGMP